LFAIRDQRYNEVKDRIHEKYQQLAEDGLFQGKLGEAVRRAAETTDRPDAQNPRGSGSGPSGSGSGPANPVGVRRGDENVSGGSDRGSSVLASPRGDEAPTAPTAGGGSVSADDYAKGIEAARKKTSRENAADHKAETVDTGNGKAVVMDPDAYALWHRAGLGDKIAWRGMTLPRSLANRVVVALRGMAGTERTFPGGAAPAAGFDRLVDSIGEARNPDGSVTFLRGDYRPDTAREEAWHRRQLQNGLHDSDALATVARSPEFKAAAEELRSLGYGMKRGSEGEMEVAREMMAKALAGDPELTLTNEQRSQLVKTFLTAAADEKGPGIFDRMPSVDPSAEAAITEAQKEYGDRGNEEGRGGPVRRAAEGHGPRSEQGPGVEGRPLHGAGERESEGAGAQPGVRKEGEEDSKLSYQRARRQQDVRPEDSMLRPGMEDADRERTEARGEAEGQELTEAMRTPKADISGKAGEMEKHAPLFRDSDASGQSFLFQIDKDEENPVARSVRGLIEDLEKMPRPDRGTRLDQVSDWLGSRAADSVTRTGDFWGTRQGKLEKALAKTKAVFSALVDDYRNPPKETGWKEQVGQMQLARTETALQMRGFARELREAAPDRLSRIAMTHWIEAGGRPEKLREWAVKARSRYEASDSGAPRQLKTAWRDAVRHYEVAEKLTPQQKELEVQVQVQVQENQNSISAVTGSGKAQQRSGETRIFDNWASLHNVAQKGWRTITFLTERAAVRLNAAENFRDHRALALGMDFEDRQAQIETAIHGL
jgi:hypothetical protein